MISVGTCATLACLWEATAPKPGNVYRGADFEDLTYADFLASAAVIGPLVERTREAGVGATVLASVEATQAAVATNTNLGMLLLLVPLAAVDRRQPLVEGIGEVLAGLDSDDTQQVYTAIRAAYPGGLGEVADADVRDTPPDLPLVEAMRLADARDSIARQYTNGFQQAFVAADLIAQGSAEGLPLSEAIVRCHLQLLAELPDSLIARKCGMEVAQEVSLRASRVLASDDPQQLADFDFWLRSEGQRRNPGTTADLVAAGLFVLLREQRLDWPVRFYPR